MMHALDDNIYLQLGFAEKEAAALLERSRLLVDLLGFMKRKGLTVSRATALCHAEMDHMTRVLEGDVFHTSCAELSAWLECMGAPQEI